METPYQNNDTNNILSIDDPLQVLDRAPDEYPTLAELSAAWGAIVVATGLENTRDNANQSASTSSTSSSSEGEGEEFEGCRAPPSEAIAGLLDPTATTNLERGSVHCVVPPCHHLQPLLSGRKALHDRLLNRRCGGNNGNSAANASLFSCVPATDGTLRRWISLADYCAYIGTEERLKAERRSQAEALRGLVAFGAVPIAASVDVTPSDVVAAMEAANVACIGHCSSNGCAHTAAPSNACASSLSSLVLHGHCLECIRLFALKPPTASSGKGGSKDTAAGSSVAPYGYPAYCLEGPAVATDGEGGECVRGAPLSRGGCVAAHWQHHCAEARALLEQVDAMDYEEEEEEEGDGEEKKKKKKTKISTRYGPSVCLIDDSASSASTPSSASSSSSSSAAPHPLELRARQHSAHSVFSFVLGPAKACAEVAYCACCGIFAPLDDFATDNKDVEGDQPANAIVDGEHTDGTKSKPLIATTHTSQHLLLQLFIAAHVLLRIRGLSAGMMGAQQPSIVGNCGGDSKEVNEEGESHSGEDSDAACGGSPSSSDSSDERPLPPPPQSLLMVPMARGPDGRLVILDAAKAKVRHATAVGIPTATAAAAANATSPSSPLFAADNARLARQHPFFMSHVADAVDPDAWRRRLFLYKPSLFHSTCYEPPRRSGAAKGGRGFCHEEDEGGEDNNDEKEEEEEEAVDEQPEELFDLLNDLFEDGIVETVTGAAVQGWLGMIAETERQQAVEAEGADESNGGGHPPPERLRTESDLNYSGGPSARRRRSSLLLGASRSRSSSAAVAVEVPPHTNSTAGPSVSVAHHGVDDEEGDAATGDGNTTDADAMSTADCGDSVANNKSFASCASTANSSRAGDAPVVRRRLATWFRYRFHPIEAFPAAPAPKAKPKPPAFEGEVKDAVAAAEIQTQTHQTTTTPQPMTAAALAAATAEDTQQQTNASAANGRTLADLIAPTPHSISSPTANNDYDYAPPVPERTPSAVALPFAAGDEQDGFVSDLGSDFEYDVAPPGCKTKKENKKGAQLLTLGEVEQQQSSGFFAARGIVVGSYLDALDNLRSVSAIGGNIQQMPVGVLPNSNGDGVAAIGAAAVHSPSPIPPAPPQPVTAFERDLNLHDLSTVYGYIVEFPSEEALRGRVLWLNEQLQRLATNGGKRLGLGAAEERFIATGVDEDEEDEGIDYSDSAEDSDADNEHASVPPPDGNEEEDLYEGEDEFHRPFYTKAEFAAEAKAKGRRKKMQRRHSKEDNVVAAVEESDDATAAPAAAAAAAVAVDESKELHRVHTSAFTVPTMHNELVPCVAYVSRADARRLNADYAASIGYDDASVVCSGDEEDGSGDEAEVEAFGGGGGKGMWGGFLDLLQRSEYDHGRDVYLSEPHCTSSSAPPPPPAAVEGQEGMGNDSNPFAAILEADGRDPRTGAKRVMVCGATSAPSSTAGAPQRHHGRLAAHAATEDRSAPLPIKCYALSGHACQGCCHGGALGQIIARYAKARRLAEARHLSGLGMGIGGSSSNGGGFVGIGYGSTGDHQHHDPNNHNACNTNPHGSLSLQQRLAIAEAASRRHEGMLVSTNLPQRLSASFSEALLLDGMALRQAATVEAIASAPCVLRPPLPPPSKCAHNGTLRSDRKRKKKQVVAACGTTARSTTNSAATEEGTVAAAMSRSAGCPLTQGAETVLWLSRFLAMGRVMYSAMANLDVSDGDEWRK